MEIGFKNWWLIETKDERRKEKKLSLLDILKQPSPFRENEWHNVWGTKIGLWQPNFISLLPV